MHRSLTRELSNFYKESYIFRGIVVILSPNIILHLWITSHLFTLKTTSLIDMCDHWKITTFIMLLQKMIECSSHGKKLKKPNGRHLFRTKNRWGTFVYTDTYLTKWKIKIRIRNFLSCLVLLYSSNCVLFWGLDAWTQYLAQVGETK